MSGDVTYQALERLTHMPDNPSNPADAIAGQKYYDVEFTGGSISNVTLTDVTINGTATARTETIITATGGYTIQPSDYVITVNRTIPESASIIFPASPTTSRSIIVKDGQGEATDFPITCDFNGKTCDGASTVVIDINWQSLEFIYNGTEWNTISSYKDASAGDVVGPASSVDNAITRFDGTTGKVLQNSPVTIADTTGVFSGSQGFNFSGTTSGQTLVKANATASGTLTLPAATDTLVGKATTDTLTNKTLTAPTLTGDVVVDNLKTSGSSGVVIKNSAGTTAASFGIAGTTNGDIVGGLNVGSTFSVTGVITANNLTSSQAVHTNGSKQLVSVANTGSGNNVLATSPTLVTPILGTPTSGILTNCTGLPISTGVSGLAAGAATFLDTPSSANLAALLTDETGTGANVFAASPTLTGTVNAANITLTGLALTAASTTSSAGLRLPHGTAPSSPTNGDLWTTTDGVYARVNGVTRNLIDSFEFLGAFTATNSATLPITSAITSTYDNYMIVLDTVRPLTDNVSLNMQVSTDNGSTWVTTGSYSHARASTIDAGTTAGAGGTAATAIILAGGLGNSTGESISGLVTISGVNNTSFYTYVDGKFNGVNQAPNYFTGYGGGVYVATATVNAVRLLMSSGNITGTVYVYGGRKNA